MRLDARIRTQWAGSDQSTRPRLWGATQPGPPRRSQKRPRPGIACAARHRCRGRADLWSRSKERAIATSRASPRKSPGQGSLAVPLDESQAVARLSRGLSVFPQGPFLTSGRGELSAASFQFFAGFSTRYTRAGSDVTPRKEAAPQHQWLSSCVFTGCIATVRTASQFASLSTSSPEYDYRLSRASYLLSSALHFVQDLPIFRNLLAPAIRAFPFRTGNFGFRHGAKFWTGGRDEAGETVKLLCAWLALERIAVSTVQEVSAVVFPF